ncbi:MAG: glucoamylase family protein, partial [Acidiferrobacteraceae bacterium]
MEQHGKTLATSHTLAPRRGPDHLLARLAANEAILINVCNLLTAAVTANHRITPASEWLLDNFYLIEEQIRTAKRHLPKVYSRELPRLGHGPSAGLPRVYDLALETIAHGDGRVDPDNLMRFVAAYQTVTDLTLGELWAIPIMLRLALIENLRRVATRISAGRIDRDLAGTWATQMISVADKDPKSLILVIADMARSSPPMTTPFVSELARRLQGQSAALALPLTWIEQRLAESELTIEQLVQSGNQVQAADQVSISNTISSLRFLRAMDWRAFVETLSIVERTLHADPAGAYGAMDFATRDSYRHVIENIAKQSHQTEGQVAERAIQIAREGATRRGCADRTAHVGFYLIDRGLRQLERSEHMRFSAIESVRRIVRRCPLLFYLGIIMLITVTLAGSLLAHVHGVPDWLLTTTGILTLLATSQLAVALANWLAVFLRSPRALPRMDFSQGIPPQSRALTVVPALLTSVQIVDELSEALEVRFLANRDSNLYFGLLTDFGDAHAQTLPTDEPLLHLAVARIEALNKKYCAGSNDIFFLFHRPRLWNSREQIWMGHERKRGKLADLNALLRGGATDSFSRVIGNMESLTSVKYVITLDTDTQLPRDSARQFIGAMAHPLNRPRYDAAKQRVCEGYGILQPRVSISLPDANRSRYANVYGGEPGIDPYTRAVSDVYQDLFGEGSFIGKGIYDIDAFEQSLSGRFPENRILSHDLLEGCYARAGLLSDVQLYEGYPDCYSADVSRRKRWIRGDWQLARWLLPGVPGIARHSFLKNPLSALSRWKLLDNLRRSLVPTALTLLLLLGWTVLSPAWFWTGSVFGVIVLPALIAAVFELLQKPSDVLPSQHLAASVRSMGRQFAQVFIALACLPYEAFFSLDAIVRTVGRMVITHRRLLEWTPSSESDANTHTTLGAAYQVMWIAPFTAITAALVIAPQGMTALAVAGPILVLWFTSPAITWWLSQPLARRSAQLTDDQTFFLRKLARKTWAFFEHFVGPEDHWLPPDNYQEHPAAVVAHRTSPTNMGLALLANLSAYDFGYISAGQLLERTENALNTMRSLEQYRGHFYNWYDTQSLKPLRPVYISSVDSGNLAGHLLTLRPGLLALADDAILGARCFEGLRDTLMILVEAEQGAAPPLLAQLKKDLASACEAPPTTLAAAWTCLAHLVLSAAQLSDDLTTELASEASRWAQALARQCQAALDEITLLTPWVTLPATAGRFAEPRDDSAPCSNFPLSPGHDQSTGVLQYSPSHQLCNNLPGANGIPTLRELERLDLEWLPAIDVRLAAQITPAERASLTEQRCHITQASSRARARIAMIEHLALKTSELAYMEYGFLYDKTRHLLAIGYNVDERRLDPSYYDLLASEARFCTFVAIAQGQLPQQSWFTLGRQLTTAGGGPVLLSWSGSMFEYLMPLLVMPAYDNTLLTQTYQAVVARQIAYGSQRGVPWGMSESGFNAIDVHLNYQYRAFGVPGLGLKRGLAEDLVIAPYASALALMVAPEAACINLQRLAGEGMVGTFGFYEAVDYTPSRLPRGQSRAVVRSFMAHHQGMSLLSLTYLLLDQPMQRRFESDPLFRATLLLLHERVPKAMAVYSYTAEISDTGASSKTAELPVRILDSPHTPIPEVQLLSNGRYHVMITSAGGGYSRWKDLSVTRWREDGTCDNWGTFCYLRDVASGDLWSTTYQPTLKRPENYEAIFSEGRAEFRRHDHDFDTHADIVVSPEDDIELRRVRITNRSKMRRAIDITSYTEVVLAPPAADALHPAFSNLFVQTEIIHSRHAILCTRRPRSRDDAIPWMFHLMAVHGVDIGAISYETDRLQFIGRGNSAAIPAALSDSEELSGSEGSVLDPIVAIRVRVVLDPEQSTTIDMVTGIGESRDAALTLIEKYRDRRLADRVFELAWTHSQVVLRQINATEADAQLYRRLANSIIYANASLRADTDILLKNRRGQSGLWGYAISGDLPIVLLQISASANVDLVRQLVQSHAYWRLKGLAVDLVIWNDDRAGYRQLLHEQIMGLVAAGVEPNIVDRPGSIFIRPADQMSDEDRILLQSVARCIISDNHGTLEEQINSHGLKEVRVPRFRPTRSTFLENPTAATAPRDDLILHNGLGGFTPDGREYVITTTHGQVTPAPWVNVLANPYFGSVISESGRAYTWSENAHEFRLTPWNNDPVTDASGEAFYLRDEESGHFWSPTPLPRRGTDTYVSRHGFGYSVFEHNEGGIRSELWAYVDLDLTVKFIVLKVRNESSRSRRLSATGYVEWVLGDLRPKSAMHVVTEIDPGSGAWFA